ncbi:MAG: hypothetical protein U1A78_09245 [Polyangia bacterium]
MTALRGFALLTPEAPLALSRPGWDVDQPVADPTPAGVGALTLWGRMAPRNEAASSLLFRGTIEQLGQPDQAGSLDSVLAPTAPWEGRGLSGPAWLPGEAGEPTLLFYQGEDGSVGVAERLADGSLVKRTVERPLIAAAVLAGGAESPGPAPGPVSLGRVSPVRAGTRLRLYYTVDSLRVQFAEAELGEVRARLSDPRAALALRISAPLLWASACTVNPGKRGAAPAERLDGLSVRRVLTPAGRARFDLYAQASGGGKSALVAASSYSGGGPGDPFLAVDAPLLAGLQNSAGSPSVTEHGGRALLLLSLREVQLGVALARQPTVDAEGSDGGSADAGAP